MHGHIRLDQKHNKEVLANKEHPGVVYREPDLLIIILFDLFVSSQ